MSVALKRMQVLEILEKESGKWVFSAAEAACIDYKGLRTAADLWIKMCCISLSHDEMSIPVSCVLSLADSQETD